MTALYLERYLNYGLTRDELQSGTPDHRHRPDRAATSSPCNRHHLELAQRVKDGIRDAGGIAARVPRAPDAGDGQAADRSARPQPRLPGPRRGAARLSARRRRAHDRLRQDDACPADGGGHREHSRHRAVGRADARRLLRRASSRARAPSSGTRASCWPRTRSTTRASWTSPRPPRLSAGHCNTMGTALSMNCLAEALGMSLPGCAAIPGAVSRARADGVRHGTAHRRDGGRGPDARPRS